ncbi:MAG: DUF790 family protein [Pyrinomonadaceae bacterium]|nr:DUF790 family protein [Pyrinomonadaceae bacterium]
MLTADLAINFRRGDDIKPRLLRVSDANFLREAENLIAIFDESIEKTRGEIEAELEEYVGTGTDYRILRGLIKLISDRCEYETSSVAEPSEIRRAVFFAAKEFQPVLPDSETREKVLAKIAVDFNCSPQEIESSLYADLSAQQRLIKFETLNPSELLERYNLAQAQAILYRCAEMKIWLEPSDAKNYRRIFDSIKYFKLIHHVSGDALNGYEITITGAASVFHRSQKYGVQMSVFLPALLNCESWRMRAEIDLKSGERAFYHLNSEQNEISSSYLDEPEYENPVAEKLLKNWSKHESALQLVENKEVVDLGKTIFAPDFVLIAPCGDKVFLEILGFWTPKILEKRLEQLESSGFKSFIIAAWEELRGSRDDYFSNSENVILFKRNLEPQLLENLVEKIVTS